MIASFKEVKLTSENKEQQLKNEINSFVSIGGVRKDKLNGILTEYIAVLKGKLNGLKMKPEQIEATIFKVKIDSFAVMENSKDLFYKEKNLQQYSQKNRK